MIIENQLIPISIGRSNIRYFKERGYIDIKIGDKIKVPIKDLKLGSHVKVDVVCDYCGEIIHPQYRDYIKYKFDKYSCAKCRQRKTSDNNLLERQESLYNKAISFCNKKNYILLTPKEEIQTSSTKIKYSCPIHGVHETKIYMLVLEHGCPECSNEYTHMLARVDLDKLLYTFSLYDTELLNPEDYKGWNYKNLKIRCKECNNIFSTSYGAFKKCEGQLCPKCSNSISRGEYKIKQYLDKYDINYEKEYRFSDCKDKNPLPFDFYLPDFNICIEYDGEGHYMPIPRNGNQEEASQIYENVKRRDLIKTNYCYVNHIDLIRIPYWDYDNIINILEKKLFT